MNAKEFVNALPECEGAVLDLDKSLVDDRVAGGIGGRFLKREAVRLHLGNAIYGIMNYGKVLKKAEESETEGLRYFFEVLGDRRFADKKSAYRFAGEFIKKHELPGAKDFVDFLNDAGIETFISTAGCDIAAEAAADYFGCRKGIGNKVVYYEPKNKAEQENPIIRGCEITINHGKTKLDKTSEMLEEYGIDLTDCIVLGNDLLDYHTMYIGAISVASPLADFQGRRFPNEHVQIQDYGTFTEAMKGYSPKKI